MTGGGPREPQGGRWRTTGAVRGQEADHESRVAGYENRGDGMKGRRPLKTVMSGAPVRVPTTPECDPVDTGGCSNNSTTTMKSVGESVGVSDGTIHPRAEDGGSVGTGPGRSDSAFITMKVTRSDCIFEDMEMKQSDTSVTNPEKEFGVAGILDYLPDESFRRNSTSPPVAVVSKTSEDTKDSIKDINDFENDFPPCAGAVE